MERKVTVDEDILIELCALASLHQSMIYFLTENVLRQASRPSEWEGLIDGLQSILSQVKTQPTKSERDAVIASDIGVRLQDEARKLTDKLRARML